MGMVGSYAINFHEGSRSEILADYLFSAWGTVTPVRRQDDFGLDLYCTLADRVGNRAVVREYFVVQVKSDDEPWRFEHEESVKWLVQYPSPLFLAWVNKEEGVVRVYHVMARFLVWALGELPSRLILTPEVLDAGCFVEWQGGENFSLSAPIIRASLSDLADFDRMKELRRVFVHWVSCDRDNCDLVRRGLLRFRMPPSYRVNELPDGSIGEMGSTRLEPEFLRHGIVALAESAECVGAQLGRSGDHAAAFARLCLSTTCKGTTGTRSVTSCAGNSAFQRISAA